MTELPQRDIAALVEALRIRSVALTGEMWERDATHAMMQEAAQRLEELAALPSSPPRAPELAKLRAIIVKFQEGTPQPTWKASDLKSIELAAIHKTLNVVLAEIDKLAVPRSPQQQEPTHEEAHHHDETTTSRPARASTEGQPDAAAHAVSAVEAAHDTPQTSEVGGPSRTPGRE